MKYLIFLLPIHLFGTISARFVEQQCTTGNFLFEGNLPQDASGNFSLTALISALKKAYSGAFPNKYNLIVISHLTTETATETVFLLNIYKYFKGSSATNPSQIPQQTAISGAGKGTLYWWPVRGFVAHNPPFDSNVSWATLDAAYDTLTQEEVSAVLVNQSFEGQYLYFPALINLIENLMQQTTVLPQVIYVHSRRGANRNTVSISGYLMKTAQDTVEDAWNSAAPTPSSPEQVYQPEQAKSFLYYYKRYLELF